MVQNSNSNFPPDIFRSTFECKNIPPLSELVKSWNTSDLFQCWLENTLHGVFVPQAQILENGYLFGLSEYLPSPVRNKMSEFVAYDSNLKPVKTAGHFKYGYIGFTDNHQLPHTRQQGFHGVKEISGNAYYMGSLIKHYGHFFLESLTRYWYALGNRIDSNTIFVYSLWAKHSGNPEEFKRNLFNSFRGEFFDALGFTPDNIKFVTKPTRFERLIIPQCAYSISSRDCFVSEKAHQVWRYLNEVMSEKRKKDYEAKECYDKIYISRRKVKHPAQNRHIVNEKEVEDLFGDFGFSIVFPEELDSQFEMQLILSKCRVAASAPGSGLQNSVFIPSGADILTINGENMFKRNKALIHQVSLDYISGHQTYAYYEKDLDDSDDFSTRINIRELSHFLEDFFSGAL